MAKRRTAETSSVSEQMAQWGSLGGKARAETLPAAKRSAIARKAGKARAKSLTAAERKRIARLGVEARERKRQQKGGGQ